MEVFFGNFPPNMDADALRRFVGDAGGHSTYTVVKKRGYNGTLCYGQATIEPDSAARKVIKRFNGAELNGRLLAIHPFVHRTCANERRALNWRSKSWIGTERRCGDRRGHGSAYQAA